MFSVLIVKWLPVIAYMVLAAIYAYHNICDSRENQREPNGLTQEFARGHGS